MAGPAVRRTREVSEAAAPTFPEALLSGGRRRCREPLASSGASPGQRSRARQNAGCGRLMSALVSTHRVLDQLECDPELVEAMRQLWMQQLEMQRQQRTLH